MVRKTLLVLILLACLLCSVTVVSAEETDEREWQQPRGGSFSFSGNSGVNDPPDDEKEIQPTPQPALDLPSVIVFCSVTLLICLIVMFPAKRPSVNYM